MFKVEIKYLVTGQIYQRKIKTTRKKEKKNSFFYEMNDKKILCNS